MQGTLLFVLLHSLTGILYNVLVQSECFHLLYNKQFSISIQQQHIHCVNKERFYLIRIIDGGYLINVLPARIDSKCLIRKTSIEQHGTFSSYEATQRFTTHETGQWTKGRTMSTDEGKRRPVDQKMERIAQQHRFQIGNEFHS